MPSSTIWQQRRILANIEAIETFLGMLDKLDLSGLDCRLGAHNPPRMPIRNVEVSVRPEVILSRSPARGGRQIGALKLHFPKTNPLYEDSAGYVSAVTHRFCDAYLVDEGSPNSQLCYVIDGASATVYPGTKSTINRLKDVDAACEQIFNLWATVKEE
jgi:hypothetical protein